MATSILLRSDISVQSAQGSKDVATRCLPAAGATACTADDDLTDDQILALRQALITFELTDDIVNSEDKLHALFSKWLLHNKPHFDIEDEKAFKKRFEIFKDNARRIHEYNNSCHHSACGINSNADLTLEEHLDGMCGSHPMEAFEEELEGMGGSNPLETFEEHLDGMCWSHPMKAVQVTAGIASMYGGSV
ncbi:hypothetical protein MKW94_027410 [Papaver nudicaule]|uniref:Cathepsin propeptide inhibitor domain-containing protein n=1 Tax=Papaver nudicaule TaxID=74823 RepID=A0AA41VUK7_PAPNU|nr:hypothetical protein [Papaver nudicaule]